MPNDGGTGCNTELSGITRTLNTSFHEFDWIYKVDLVLGKNDRLFGRYIFQKSNFLNQESGDAAEGYPINIPALSQIMLIDWTHSFSARAVNQFRASWGRENVEFGGNTIGTVPNQQNLGEALAQISFQAPGLATYGVESGLPQGRIVNTYQYQDNFSITAGNHQIKAGANFTRQYSPNVFLPNYNGVYTFPDWGTYAANTPAFDGITQGCLLYTSAPRLARRNPFIISGIQSSTDTHRAPLVRFRDARVRERNVIPSRIAASGSRGKRCAASCILRS